jgi:hypothetical protein
MVCPTNLTPNPFPRGKGNKIFSNILDDGIAKAVEAWNKESAPVTD